MSDLTKLSVKDYSMAAAILGCEPAVLMAVAEVESAGGGFDDNGRIKLRFEGHKFREYTQRKFDGSNPEISYPYRIQSSKKHGYNEFNQAFRLNAEAALLSSSFGKFQPMGFTHDEADFDNVFEFVDYLKVSEANQLLVFVKLVKFRRLDDELRRKDWAGFAKNYNGASYRDNDYDGKMARAYKRILGSTKFD